MAFSKSFPKTKDKYTSWEEVPLTEKEEAEVEAAASEENIKIMQECISEAKLICKETGLKDYQTDMVQIALTLFDKMASHQVYWKERACREKFDKTFKPLIKKP